MTARFGKIALGGVVLLIFVIGVVMTAYTAMWIKLLVFKTTRCAQALHIWKPLTNMYMHGGLRPLACSLIDFCLALCTLLLPALGE